MIDEQDLPVTNERLPFGNLCIFTDAQGEYGYYDEAGLVGGSGFATRDEAIFALGGYCYKLNMEHQAVIIHGHKLDSDLVHTIHTSINQFANNLRNSSTKDSNLSKHYLQCIDTIKGYLKV